MLATLLRSYRFLLPASLLMLGLALGHLAATVVGLRLRGATPLVAEPVPMVPPPAAPQLADYGIIVERSLFAPHLAGKYRLDGASAAGAAAPRGELVLLGTVAGGPRPLALIRLAGENRTVHLGDTLADGGKVIAIARQQLKIRAADGSEQLYLPPELPPPDEAATPARSNAAPAPTGSSERWTIPRAEAEKARANIGELLREARLEPHIVNGRTDGFEVRMVKPNTLFTSLDLRVGDIVKQVNGLILDGPEKALQIVQQLREARRIVIGLERNGAPLSFEYVLE